MLLLGCLVLCGSISASDEAEVSLGSSLISPDYIEIEMLKGTKNVIVIEKKDIEEKGYQSVSEVLDDVPGVTVGKSGWGQIDIRGQGENGEKNIQVLVDGAPITTLVSHPYVNNYDVIPVEQIEKIEVIPGGGSVLYGNGTVGGVVNITTNLKAMNRPINKVGVETTLNHEDKHYVNLGTNIGDKITAQFNYSQNKKNWYFVDTYNDMDYFSGGFNYRMSDSQGLSFQYSRMEQEGQFIKQVDKSKLEEEGENYRPDPNDNVTVGLDENGLKIKGTRSGYLTSDGQTDNAKLSYVNKINDKISLTVDMFYNDGFFTNNADYELAEETGQNKFDTETIGGKAKLDIKYGERNVLLLGADYFKQSGYLHYDDYESRMYYDGYELKEGEYIYTSSNGNKYYAMTEAEDEIFDMFEIGWRDYIWGSALNLTLFYNETDNQMDRVYMNGFKESRTVNFLDTERYGLEFSANQEVGKFSFKQSYAYLKGESKYNEKGLAAGEDAEENEDTLVEANFVTDFSVRYRNDDGLSIYGGINNLFDEEYYSYSSDGSSESRYNYVVPGYRRTLFLGASYTF